MNEERALILKMLKEGKISVEEADALIEALGEEEGTQSARQRTNENPRAERHPHDFSDMGDSLKIGIKEFAKSMEGTIRDAVDGIKSLNIGNAISEAFGRARATDEKEIILSSDEITAVDLKGSAGDVEVVGNGRDEILILAKIAATGKDEESAARRAKEVEIKHQITDGVLTIRDSGLDQQITGPYSVDYHLTVPRSVRLQVRVADGDLSVKSIDGGTDVKTFSGDIDCKDCSHGVAVNTKSGDIKFDGCGGPIEARTLSGDIDLDEIESNNLTCNSLSGDIRVDIISEVTEKIEARTLSGDVSVALPSSSKVSIKADTLSGDINCSLPVKEVEKKGHRYSAVLNDPEGMMILSTKSGDIDIEER